MFSYPFRSHWHPKRKITTQEKGKGKVGEGSNCRRRAEEPTSDGGIPQFLTPEAQESYVDKWKGKNYHQERMIQRADFQEHLLEHEIDTPESSHQHKTWVRGKWIRFSPVMIDRYYELNRTGIDPMPAEEDMQSVTRICLKAGVFLLPFEKADTREVPLTHKTIDNSEARMRAREIRARRAPAVQPDEAAHDPAPPVPQPALAADTNLGIQFTQIQVALTEIGRPMNNIQNT
ncbi:Uncharacterized protein Adt_03500 [Abeliophyllum distichum]|uniref:Uncharacterized protein n=1 Tax=Abeliophyllum distichum TaxID=126358 RepID=A0ABD1VYY5_9LAMI